MSEMSNASEKYTLMVNALKYMNYLICMVLILLMRGMKIIMTMMENWNCKNKEKANSFMCNSKESVEIEYGLTDCKYCGQKNVNIKHICKEKIKHLTHYCLNCGLVSDNPDYLCNPVEIDEIKKKYWGKVAEKGQVKFCKVCSQPLGGVGHVCDPIVPYNCEYCGRKVTESFHFCKEGLEKAEYFCNLCGKLANNENQICSGWKLK